MNASSIEPGEVAVTGSRESVGAKSAPILTGCEGPEADGELPPEPDAHPVSPRAAATMTAPRRNFQGFIVSAFSCRCWFSLFQIQTKDHPLALLRYSQKSR